MSPAPNEVAKIEQELDILRARHAIFQRWAGIVKWFFISGAVAVAATAVGYGIVHDPLVAAIMAVVVVVIAGIAYVGRSDRNLRWIDIASPGPCYGKISEAAAVEAMIADREKRLAELKARPA